MFVARGTVPSPGSLRPRLSLLAAVAFALLLAATASADESPGAPLIPRRDLFADTARWAVTLAPDGRHIAWLEDAGAGPAVHVSAAELPDAPHVVAVPAVRTFRWTDDGRLLLVAVAPPTAPSPQDDVADGNTSDTGAAGAADDDDDATAAAPAAASRSAPGDRLLLLDAVDAAPRDITPLPGARLELTVSQPHLRDALLLVVLAPDGEATGGDADAGDGGATGEGGNDNGEADDSGSVESTRSADASGERRSGVWRVELPAPDAAAGPRGASATASSTMRPATDDIAGGDRAHGAAPTSPSATRIAALDGAMRFWADDSLTLRAAWRSLPDGTAALVRRADGGWIEHARYGWESARASGVVSLTADGRTLYLVDDVGLDKAALKAVDVASGAETVLAIDPLADVLPAGATVTTGGDVQAVVAYFARMRRQVLDPSVAADFELLRSALPGETSFAGRSADDRVWLLRSMDGGPLDYWLLERDTRRVRHLFSDQPALDGALLASRHAVAVPARDGLLLACHLYLPPGSDADGDGRPERPLPTVLYVHGGPWVGGEWNIWFTNRSFQLLANRGYAVLRTDFRGAGGYGKAFMDAGDRQWSGAMRTDLLDIAAWAVEQGIADDERLAMWGWSYGGYTTASALAFTPDVFACGIAMYGVYDVLAFTEHVNARWGPGAAMWNRRVGDPHTEEGRAALWHDSPQRLVSSITAPLLVTHGTLDDRVPIAQSEAFVAALREAGKDVRYLVYPGEPHDYRRAESWESFWAEGEAFLRRHLGGRAEPMTDEHERAGMVVG